MKIALYLGSFNPFHNGHLEVVKTALNDFKMNGVIIVPTMQNPWKKEKVLDIDKRLKIINKSLLITKKDYNNPGFYDFYYPKGIGTSLIEKELIPPYYSYATLHALKNKYCNDEVFVLCGEDTIKDIPNWMHGGTIIQDYDFLVVDRPEDAISSTCIREKIKNGETISDYVSSNVVDLIKKYYA
jgi:nicotinate-nucleotide adenylyltransferase